MKTTSPTDVALDTTGVEPPPLSTEVTLVSARDLPFACPPPGAPLWNMHPRVYLPIEDAPDGEAVCPYCGARYRLDGPVTGHH